MSKTKDNDAMERESRKIDSVKFGNRISALMKEQGYTDKTFAEAVGISVDMVKEIRYGRRLPGLNNYMLIIETLGVSDLLPMSDSLPKEKYDLVKKDRIETELLPITENMSQEQFEEFMTGIRCFTRAFSGEKQENN